MAGHEDDVITVTLEKNDVPSQTEMSRSFSDRLIPENNFDRAKWNALLQYDKDIEAAAEKIRPLGPKWMDEFGFSYLSLNDKNYLTTIIEKIAERARLEQQENEKLRVEEEKKSKEDAEKLARAEEEAIKKSQAEDKKENRQKLIGFGILLIVLLMIVALIASYKN